MILNKIDLPNEFFPGTVKNFAPLALFPCFKVLLPGGLLEFCCCSSTIIHTDIIITNNENWLKLLYAFDFTYYIIKLIFHITKWVDEKIMILVMWWRKNVKKPIKVCSNEEKWALISIKSLKLEIFVWFKAQKNINEF